MDETKNMKEDLAHLARLALTEKPEDVRMFLARLVRKYRSIDPSLADQFDLCLRNKPSRTSGSLRKVQKKATSDHPFPFDGESRLSLLKRFDDHDLAPPLLGSDVEEILNQLIQERRQSERLASLGLSPARSAIFLGNPGVGKTLTARWLASQLGLPLYVLDLTAVMSSLLGKTGANLRAVIDFAKERQCILLLDEIDSIAKRRSDDTDVGELKRLVTVILQEVESWPASGLLLAATNNPELIDPALWRRFDLIVKFSMPDIKSIKEAVQRFLGPDYPVFVHWIDTLAYAFRGSSYSDIERTLQRFRRAIALGVASVSDLIEDFISSTSLVLERQERIEFATLLTKQTKLSQHAISDLTGVSRDTIRKHTIR